jgi:hypothetical protein
VRWLSNSRLAVAIGASAAVLIAPAIYFPGDCGDTLTGANRIEDWTCNTSGYIALYVAFAAACVLAGLLLIALWRAGRRFANRSAKPS